MKSKILIFTFFISFIGNVNQIDAQPMVQRESYNLFGIGVRYMPTISDFQLQRENGDVINADFTLGYGFGGMLELNLSKNIGLQTEFIYNDLSQKYIDRELNQQIHINYINLPVLFALNTNKAKRANLNFVLGPQFGLNVGSRIKTTTENDNQNVQTRIALKTSDIGIAYGGGLELSNFKKTLRLDLGFRGMYGLMSIDGNAEGTYNIIDNSPLKTYAAYVGLTLLF